MALALSQEQALSAQQSHASAQREAERLSRALEDAESRNRSLYSQVAAQSGDTSALTAELAESQRKLDSAEREAQRLADARIDLVAQLLPAGLPQPTGS